MTVRGTVIIRVSLLWTPFTTDNDRKGHGYYSSYIIVNPVHYNQMTVRSTVIIRDTLLLTRFTTDNDRKRDGIYSSYIIVNPFHYRRWP